MKKWVLSIVLGFVSVNCLATSLTSNRIQPPLMNALKPFSSVQVMGTDFPMIYSGQDVSRQVVATTDHAIRAGQGTIIV